MTEIERFFDKSGMCGISGLWSLATSEGIVEGQKADVEAIELTEKGAKAIYHGLLLESTIDASSEGIRTRDDIVTSLCDKDITISRVYARFVLPGGEYEVYTQRNMWQYESEGEWEKLHTKAEVWNRGIRSTEGASPMLALWNRQTNHGMVFHLFANCNWKISASMENCGSGQTASCVVVEAGINDRDLSLVMKAGETISLPKLVYYTFENKQDLDCHRLHAWFNRLYPRKLQPVIFNTWMATFDWLEVDSLYHHVDAASDVGAEYFVIDAGWFGIDGRWYDNIGAWVENQTNALCGHMKDVADYVRKKGMKFGLWLEAERALENVPIVKEHPDWFFYNGTEYLTDFSNPETVHYFIELTNNLVDQYGIDYIKFDFNAGISYDPTRSGFLRWHKGHRQYMEAVRQHKPDIFLECCASGGIRMEMYTASLYDSCWMSDNHSVYEGVRILKDTSLRLSPCCIDKWPVLKDADGFISYGVSGTVRKILASDDAEWVNVRGVNKSWIQAFVAGGSLGLSFDMTSLCQDTMKDVKEFVHTYKNNRDFYKNAMANILCDSQYITATEYRNEKVKESKIVVFVWKHKQNFLTIFPHVCETKMYIINEKRYTGKELFEYGYSFELPGAQNACVISIKEDELFL